MKTYGVAKLTESGLSRVLDGAVGMTFPIKHVSVSGSGEGHVAHVMDFRYPRYVNGELHAPYQIWSLGVGDWELVEVERSGA